MADRPPYPENGGDTGVGPDHGSPPGMPRWVKMSAIVVAVLVVLFVGLSLAGVGGEHGPRRHGPGQQSSGDDIGGDRGGTHDPSGWDHG